MNVKEKVEQLLKTQEAKDAKLLMSYAIKKSKTLTDDEIVENVDEVVEAISDSLNEIAGADPTGKEALQAALRLLKAIAAQTSTKWDDRAVAILDVII